MLPSYEVRCTRPGCSRLAVYKIAARWSDGVTQELKTYALTCPDCLEKWFRQSRKRQAACRTVQGEILEPPGIFLMAHGHRDRQLQRLPELEQQLAEK